MVNQQLDKILRMLRDADDRLQSLIGEGDYTEDSDAAMFQLDLARQRLVEVVGMVEDVAYG